MFSQIIHASSSQIASMPRLDEATLSMLRRKVTDAELEEAQRGNVIDVAVAKAAIAYVRVDTEGQTQQVSAVRCLGRFQGVSVAAVALLAPHAGERMVSNPSHSLSSLLLTNLDSLSHPTHAMQSPTNILFQKSGRSDRLRGVAANVRNLSMSTGVDVMKRLEFMVESSTFVAADGKTYACATIEKGDGVTLLKPEERSKVSIGGCCQLMGGVPSQRCTRVLGTHVLLPSDTSIPLSFCHILYK